MDKKEISRVKSLFFCLKIPNNGLMGVIRVLHEPRSMNEAVKNNHLWMKTSKNPQNNFG